MRALITATKLVSLLMTFVVMSFTTSAFAAQHSTLLGEFNIVNTAGFIEKDNVRHEMPFDLDTMLATLRLSPADNSLQITLQSGAKMRLFYLRDGISSFDWDPGTTTLLHSQDVMQIAGAKRPEDVTTWGASLDWPGIGEAKLVVFKYYKNFFGGFLVSKSQDGGAVVRQMEIHRLLGPRRRADRSRWSGN